MRAIQGLLVTASFAAAGALLIDFAPREKISEEVGSYNTILSIGWVLGLIIGAVWLFSGEIKTLFFVCSGLALVSFILLDKYIKYKEFVHRRIAPVEPHPAIASTRYIYTPKKAIVHHHIGINEKMRWGPHAVFHLPKFAKLEKELMSYFFAIFLVIFAGTAALAPFPIFLIELGASKTQLFIIFIFNALISTFFYKPIGRIAQKISKKAIQLSSMILRSLIIFSFAYASSLTQVSVLFAIIGITWATFVVTGTVIAVNLADPDKVGEVMGIYNSVMGVAIIIGAIVGGLIAEYLGFKTLFYFAATITILSCLVLSTIRAK